MLLRAEFQGFKGFFGHVPLWERGLSGYEIDLLARVIGARLLGALFQPSRIVHFYGRIAHLLVSSGTSSTDHLSHENVFIAAAEYSHVVC